MNIESTIVEFTQAVKLRYNKIRPGLAERLRQQTHNLPKAGSTPAPWIFSVLNKDEDAINRVSISNF